MLRMMNSRVAADRIVSIGESGVEVVVYLRSTIRVPRSFRPLSAINQACTPRVTLIDAANVDRNTAIVASVSH